MTKLTGKQQRFVEEYLIDFNGLQAAIRAGYSKRTAVEIAKENLRKPYIAEALRKAIAKRSERTEITADMVLKEYAKLAFANMDSYATWGPDGISLIESSELPEGAGAVVSELSEIRTEKGSTVRFKLHDKKGALDSLARHLRMFPERLEVSGPGGGAIPIVAMDISAMAPEQLEAMRQLRDKWLELTDSQYPSRVDEDAHLLPDPTDDPTSEE